MTLKTIGFVVLGILLIAVLLYFTAFKSNRHTTGPETVKDVRTPVLSPKIRQVTREAPILRYTPSGAIEQVSIEIDPDGSPFITKKEFAPDENAVIEVVAGKGRVFTVPLVRTHYADAWEYPATDSIVVISDIDGHFDAFESFLKGNGIMDDAYRWSFGKNCLVLLGDVFDRGHEVFECLWLIYHLEQQARDAGGGVHFILGNHEIMNLTAWHRNAFLDYVDRKYMINADFISIPYTDWLDKNTELGRWLRTKNCIEKIGQTLFVHGGISPDLVASGLTIDEVNALQREVIDLPYRKYKGVHRLITSKYGPTWYRGMALEKLNSRDIEEILDQYDAQKIVVGHTIIDEEKIRPLYEKKVIAIDLNHRKTFARGILKGLLIENGQYFEIDNKQRVEKI